MEQTKIKIYLLLFFVICFGRLHAQRTFLVNPKSGASSTYSISDIKKLTFTTGTMIVNKKDASTFSFSIPEIRYMSFGMLTTNSINGLIDSESTKMSLYPIPALEVLYVQFDSRTSGTAQFQIIDLTGKMVLQQTLSSQIGTNNDAIAVSHLKHGLYLCRLQQGVTIESSKFLKN